MDWGRNNRIAREAAEWVVLIDSPAFDSASADRFRRWLARSTDHARAFRLASRAWTDLDQLAALKTYPDLLDALNAPPPAAPASSDAHRASTLSPRIDRRALLVGGAAGVIALSAAGYIALGANEDAEAFETAIGETGEVTLSDGTRVVLNAASRIEAEIGPDKRKARLLAGEALFSIAESNAGAFAIATPSGEVIADRGEVLVKLLPEGAARIALLSDGARGVRRGWLGIRQSARVVADAGSEIVFADDGVAVAASNTQALARRTLWREGMLAFDDTPLSEAVADISRQSGVRFRFADPALAEVRVGGLVRADDLSAFLDLLENNLAISAKRRNGEIVLSASER